ncbi:GtrA family protein [Halobacillus rhizosphaerae]|uniref:GtrA family protein n=1 Tax=Halobacillus rhizosphaerae TaxID=3064889 RepID=UPI00398AAFB1
MKTTIFQNSFLRFLAVGIVNTIFGLSVTFLSFHSGVSYYISTLLGTVVGAIISYLLNRTFTFKSTTSFNKSAWKFIVVILICYFFSYSVSIPIIQYGYSFLPVFMEPYQGDFTILCGAGIYTISNYLGQKYFVF